MENNIAATEQYYTIQKKEWVVVRVAWVIMGLILVASVLGLFGKGVLSNKTYTHNHVSIEYNKFMRVGKDTEILIQAKNLGQNATISINNDYIKKVRITQVVPEPAAVEVRNNTLVYIFNNINNGFVTFFLSPQKMGSQKLEITVAGNKAGFNQYIYF